MCYISVYARAPWLMPCIRNTSFAQTELKNMAVQRHSGGVYCSFNRSFYDDVLKYDFTAHEPYYVNFDFTQKQYLQIAWGGVYQRRTRYKIVYFFCLMSSVCIIPKQDAQSYF